MVSQKDAELSALEMVETRNRGNYAQSDFYSDKGHSTMSQKDIQMRSQKLSA